MAEDVFLGEARPSALGSDHYVDVLFIKGDNAKHGETEHSIGCKVPHITHWLFKMTLKSNTHVPLQRNRLLVLSYCPVWTL